MNKCCNFFCPKQAKEDDLKKAKTMKFILSKENGCQKVKENDNPIAFCDGNLTSKGESECKNNFFKIKDQVQNFNEGGPFGTPMQKLADVLRSLQDHENLMEFDKKKIKAALKDFDFELSKVSRPIKEKKFDGVE